MKKFLKLNPLDIISDSPNLFILQKETNKTNFGGFLFLIYLVLIALIIVYYALDYKNNDKYIIQSFSHFNFKTKEEREQRNHEELFNPNIKFKIIFNGKHINERFKLYDPDSDKPIESNTIFSKKINDFRAVLYYDCINLNCSDYFEFVRNISSNKTEDQNFYLELRYNGFRLEHQSEKEPINKSGGIYFYVRYKLNYNLTIDITSNWRTIKYTEKKGFLQNDNRKYGCGYIESYSPFYYDNIMSMKISKGKNRYYICFADIWISNDITQYTEYFRKEVSKLDLLANILALMANSFTAVRFILRFYSKNFNNFKIIENLLNRQIIKNYRINSSSSDISDFENNKLNPITDDFYNNIEDKNNIDNDDMNKYEENKDNDEEDLYTKKIRKLRFFDFFLNNCYCCCKKQKPQKIIHICNEIVYKYASVDNLIKNQILIENFLKDYKWNDPSLNNVENNNLFIQLKTYL